MATYPVTPRSEFLQWCQAHAPVWAVNAMEIGLTAPQTTAYTAAVTGAAAALLAQNQAQEAAKAATLGAATAFENLRDLTSTNVAAIRTYAEAQADPNTVYQTAMIPAPATPTPVAPPAKPSDLTVTLNTSSGAPTLRWKASNPAGSSGTSYIVRRRLPGEGAFTFIGVSGKKEIVDATMPAGPDWVEYTVQGQRSDSSGPLSEIFTVKFGVGGDGQVQAFVTTEAEGQQLPKLAA
ncbi:MAG: fibronectin type III domain-containing protein [Phycisphaerales bacterium]